MIMILEFNIMDNAVPLIVLTAVVAIVILYLRKEHKTESNEHLENLEDEYLYDAETGKKYTLEEAESIGFPETNPNRIKTQEEIDTYFNDEEIAVELAKNYLRKKGYKVLETETEEEVSRFENMSWWESYEGVYADTIFKISEKSYLYFVQVTYTSIGFKGSRNVLSEIQLLLWVRNPLNTQIDDLKAIKDIDYIENGKDHFFKLSKIATPEGVKQLLNQD